MSWRFTVCMGHGRGVNDNGEPITVSLVSDLGGKIYECGAVGGTWRGFLELLGEPSSAYGLGRVADGIWASNAFPGECPRSWDEAMFRLYPSRFPWMQAEPAPEPQPDEHGDVTDVYPDETEFRVLQETRNGSWMVVAQWDGGECVLCRFPLLASAEKRRNEYEDAHADAKKNAS